MQLFSWKSELALDGSPNPVRSKMMAANGNTEKELEVPQNWVDLNLNTLKSARSSLPLRCLQKLFSLSNREIFCIKSSIITFNR